MDVPAIGKAKGLFEIFIPGVFLLLNFTWMIYCLQYQYWSASNLYDSLKDNQILMLIIIIVFGYLTGVILWLFRADFPDELSASLRKFCGASEDFYNDQFPYIKSLGSIAKDYLPRESYSFYSNCWMPRLATSKNKYFFNFCKVLINAIDEKSAIEIYSSEALIRYLAAMFYALLISLFFLCFIMIVNSGLVPIGFISPFYQLAPSLKMDIISFIIFYLISLIVLLWHFRYMRFKEVQSVFTASLINKESIDRYLDEKCLSCYCEVS